ncbi:hypothetical protein E2H86_07245 [Pseudomonas putida]|nr:hypothetical protein E2H86_07245 [Pseudomonas putida]
MLRRRSRSSSDASGAALRPIRGTSPLPQDNYRPQVQRCTCGSGLVPRMGCKAAPITQSAVSRVSFRHSTAIRLITAAADT